MAEMTKRKCYHCDNIVKMRVPVNRQEARQVVKRQGIKALGSPPYSQIQAVLIQGEHEDSCDYAGRSACWVMRVKDSDQ